ncbi:biotin/lipoyl-containing protein [Edaphobacter flagellatus]|uniref:biotin/lipoyl-containing protein n=1 Tax=Edaphobacter flagellatus TaxID=1933044 RepID=UPI0028C40CC5|nr:biotin/lipoyl-containing protein [Edaphobacter flagellatus]
MTVWVEVAGKQRRVELPAEAAAGGALACAVDGIAVKADVRAAEPGVLSLVVEGRQYRCLLDGDAVIIGGRRFPFVVEDPRSLRGRRGTGEGAAGPRTVKAPMPGRVVRVLVEVGDEVAEHQGVIVIEAMKMQNELKSPKAGRVAKIAVEVEGTVGAGEALIVIE